MRGPDHKSAGAIHARAMLGPATLPLQFAIAGHHGGLPDKTDLDSRLAAHADRHRLAVAAFDTDTLPSPTELRLPTFLGVTGTADERNRRIETFTRMLYSALVDADFLDTERFIESAGLAHAGATAQRAAWPDIGAYLPTLDRHLDQLQAHAVTSGVNAHRRHVLEWCIAAAAGQRGAYTLTVPTGGGKTLSSLAFALHHARRHGHRRVIVALPFTSIIDQTVAVLRDIFEPALGSPVLVEHHSAIDPRRHTLANRLASENWDAPLVVTTQVQLFESLFANRSSRCRKLHNLANAVLILDEVQTLPCGLLAPILEQLQELVTNYQLTLLLTTATQPALHRRDLGPAVFAGLQPPPTEIVPAPAMAGLFEGLRRVRVHWPPTPAPTPWADLARQIQNHRQVLAIVHRRDDAKVLWRAAQQLGAEDLFHLSARMCPAHRREVLAVVRAALRAGRPCRVVSTQLVEAGVDVDFPVVYRAMAGLESLAQSAGRCNREGRLAHGDFHVYVAETEPPGQLRHHRDIAEVMRLASPELDLMAPETFRGYFDRLYSQNSTDVLGIQPLRAALRFETTADTFRMIDDGGATLFVPYLAGAAAIEDIRRHGPSRDRWRAIQPFGVSVYPSDIKALASAGAVETIFDSVRVLTDPARYDSHTGLDTEPRPAAALIA